MRIKIDRAMSLSSRGLPGKPVGSREAFPILLILSSATIKAQTQTFTKDDLEYILELR
jgi:hypothetical protein